MAVTRFPSTSPLATRRIEYWIFEALGEPCGVMVADRESGELAFRFRRDWADFAGEEAETLAGLAEELPRDARGLGFEEFHRLIDSFANILRVRDPQQAIAGNLDHAAQALFRKHVRSTVKPFLTHLPLYPIRAAAGGFGPDGQSEPEEWVDVPAGARRQLHEDEFLVRIQGTSMEPEIPDGSLCRFRRYAGGTRRGGIWLVMRVSGGEVTGEVTIKRYDRADDRPERSQMRRMSEGGEFNDEAVERTAPATMHPLNQHDHRDWNLDAESGDRFFTVAQFIEVVEDAPSAAPEISG